VQDFIHTAAFAVYPYIALSVFLIGSLVRFDTDQYGWRSKSSQFLRRRQLVWGSILFHAGILGILIGHGVGLLTPVAVFEFLGISHGFKQMMAIVVGGVCGLVCFVMVLLILLAQLSLGLLTIPLSLGHLDGEMMVRFMNYVQGIVTLRPGEAEQIVAAPLVFKLHMFLGFTILLIFPFTRLVHVWSMPLGYLSRRYQVVRTKHRAGTAQPEEDLPPYRAGPVVRPEPARRKEAA
jgi:nitrate reductase gamma subunit